MAGGIFLVAVWNSFLDHVTTALGVAFRCLALSQNEFLFTWCGVNFDVRQHVSHLD